jgi:hypothetical protein
LINSCFVILHFFIVYFSCLFCPSHLPPTVCSYTQGGQITTKVYAEH